MFYQNYKKDNSKDQETDKSKSIEATKIDGVASKKLIERRSAQSRKDLKLIIEPKNEEFSAIPYNRFDNQGETDSLSSADTLKAAEENQEMPLNTEKKSKGRPFLSAIANLSAIAKAKSKGKNFEVMATPYNRFDNQRETDSLSSADTLKAVEENREILPSDTEKKSKGKFSLSAIANLSAIAKAKSKGKNFEVMATPYNRFDNQRETDSLSSADTLKAVEENREILSSDTEKKSKGKFSLSAITVFSPIKGVFSKNDSRDQRKKEDFQSLLKVARDSKKGLDQIDGIFHFGKEKKSDLRNRDKGGISKSISNFATTSSKVRDLIVGKEKKSDLHARDEWGILESASNFTTTSSKIRDLIVGKEKKSDLRDRGRGGISKSASNFATSSSKVRDLIVGEEKKFNLRDQDEERIFEYALKVAIGSREVRDIIDGIDGSSDLKKSVKAISISFGRATKNRKKSQDLGSLGRSEGEGSSPNNFENLKLGSNDPNFGLKSIDENLENEEEDNTQGLSVRPDVPSFNLSSVLSEKCFRGASKNM